MARFGNGFPNKLQLEGINTPCPYMTREKRVAPRQIVGPLNSIKTNAKTKGKAWLASP